MDKYEKVRLIGEGSFGKAFLVRDRSTSKQYVIKVCIVRLIGQYRIVCQYSQALSIWGVISLRTYNLNGSSCLLLEKLMALKNIFERYFMKSMAHEYFLYRVKNQGPKRYAGNVTYRPIYDLLTFFMNY